MFQFAENAGCQMPDPFGDSPPGSYTCADVTTVGSQIIRVDQGRELAR